MNICIQHSDGAIYVCFYETTLECILLVFKEKSPSFSLFLSSFGVTFRVDLFVPLKNGNKMTAKRKKKVCSSHMRVFVGM